MKVEEVLETNAQLLSFDQIDAIAKDYISKFDGTTFLRITPTKSRRFNMD